MIVTINNAQLEYINCDFCAVYVKIPDGLYELITKRLPLSTVKNEKLGTIFARTTIVPPDVNKYRGTNITFHVKKFLESDIYVLIPVVYERKEEAKAILRECERSNSMFGIKNVIHHDPATIVYWCDGTKTVVKCGENDIYDPEKGLAMAIAKKVFGNKGNYYNQFKKWLPKEEETNTSDNQTDEQKEETNTSDNQTDEQKEETNTSDNQTDEQKEYIKKSGVMINKNPIESENT